MRYRGKDLLTGKWIYGVPTEYGDGVFISNPKLLNNDGKDWRIRSTEVIPETVGQLTPYQDIKGEKIYEGDDINSHGNTVEFSFGCWNVNGDTPLDRFRDPKVVGNKHES